MRLEHENGQVTAPSGERLETLQLLRALRYDITHVLAPEVSSSMAKMIARMADDVLTFIMGREERQPEETRRYLADRARTAETTLALAARLGVTTPADRTAVQAAMAAAGKAGTADELVAARTGLDAALERILTPVLRATSKAGPAEAAAIDGLLRDIIGTTRASEARMADGAAAEKAADTGRRVSVQATVTQERLQAYWRQRFPDRPNARVTALRELAGGFSKTTILFDVADWEDEPASLVMRRDVLGGATEASVTDEYQALCTAHRVGLPVPEILFLETDLGKLDRAFIVMRKAVGEPAGDLWRPSPACTPETGYDLARALAHLHSLDPADLGFPVKGTPQEEAKRYLDGWRASALRKQAEPDPVLEASICWVEQNMPPLPARLSFVHGDPGFWNILIKDGRITALLDWELGHLGDPAEDLSYVKPFIEVFMPWQDFLNAYVDAGGSGYSEDRGDYYGIWRDVRNAICSNFAEHAYATGANPELRMAHCGVLSYRLLLMRAANKIAETGMTANFK